MSFESRHSADDIISPARSQDLPILRLMNWAAVIIWEVGNIVKNGSNFVKIQMR